MGFDCGFDIFPRLEANTENIRLYQRFIDEILQTYGDVRDEAGRRSDGKLLSMPTDPESWDKFNIVFMVGECPSLPSNPARCDSFIRFSSKISGRLTTPAEPYIRDVFKIAARHFGSNVCFWHEMSDTGDERQWGCYNWDEVHAAARKLRELEELEGGSKDTT